MAVIAQRISERVLPWLQLTRFALVFTAIADSFSELLLRTASQARQLQSHNLPADWPQLLPLWAIAVLALMSMGLYGFGMSFNDIIDRRRDRHISPHRPLPSGRVGLVAAHIICAMLLLTAMFAGSVYAKWTSTSWASGILLGVTIGLIAFYDLAGKYLVWLGLITLGLIRFANATLAAPKLPVVWHPLLLLDHVTILSTVCYILEDKRPTLQAKHIQKVVIGLAAFNAAVIAFVAWYRFDPQYRFGYALRQALAITPALVWPAMAVAWFGILSWMVLRLTPDRRQAGGKLMLYGLLWLIVYDASFVAGYVSWWMGLAVLMLLPVSWLSVLTMRSWSKVVMLSHAPEYQRAGREPSEN